MYTEIDLIEEYPFYGAFYRTEAPDMTIPLNMRGEREVMVLDTVCDIQEASHSMRGDFIEASYSVYFPIDDVVLVRKGDVFRGTMYGLEIAGRVLGVFPSQLRGCRVYIKNLEEE